jgi:ATP-dependent Clp protease ATP-binding subunit ClpA
LILIDHGSDGHDDCQNAAAMAAKRIETSRAKLDNPSRPIGVFMLAGPSGVGKTELASRVCDMTKRSNLRAL